MNKFLIVLFKYNRTTDEKLFDSVCITQLWILCLFYWFSIDAMVANIKFIYAICVHMAIFQKHTEKFTACSLSITRVCEINK